MSNPWFEALLFNMLIYVMSIGTAWAIADWINNE